MNLNDVLEADAKRPRLSRKERSAIRAAQAELERLRKLVAAMKENAK